MIKQLPATRGAALLIFMLFFVLGSAALLLALSRLLYSDLSQQQFSAKAMQAWYAADSGLEDMVYRLMTSKGVTAEEVLSYAGSTATTTFTYDAADEAFIVVSTSTYTTAYRTAATTLYLGSGASFNFGVQSGNGGFTFTNGSEVIGNVFSNGHIEKTEGGNAWIRGDGISAGPSGIIEKVNIEGNARAHTLKDNVIEGDAYFMTESSNVVNGTKHPGSDDEDPSVMPITDEAIEAIKQDVVDNGSLIASTSPECSGGTYTIDIPTTLPSVKIECNLEVKNTQLTLLGSVWVAGNINFKSGPNIFIDSSVGARTVPIVADNETDRLTSSRVFAENSTTFTGSGNPKSYILLISQNNAAEGGDTTTNAIEVQQSSSGDLLVYASHGKILLGNSAGLKEVTGYLIHLGNNAVITYESGLVNLLFTSGPGGGFTMNGWREVY